MVGFDSDYYSSCFSTTNDEKEIIFLNNTLGNGFLSKVQKLCVSEITNKVITVPFKNIWMNDFSGWLKNYEQDVCFVFSKNQSWLLKYKNGKYFDILREKYPGCKIIMYLGNIMSSYYKFEVEFFKTRCDYLISYDEEDARKYDLIYLPLPYGKVYIENDHNISEFDVFFCGKAKDRLEDILRIYEYLSNNGLNCLFFVSGVKGAKKSSEHIIYNRRLKYSRYLQYMKKSKIILEVIPKGSFGDTLRVKEALTYGKLLITDNKNICFRDFYNPEQIFVYDKNYGIDLEKLKRNMNKEFSGKEFNEFFCTIEALCSKAKKQ